jgi:hypothetical protein
MEARSAQGERDSRPALVHARLGARCARWRSRAPRLLATAAVLTLCLLGLRDLVAPRSATRAAGPVAAVDAPSEEFAVEFARAYLTYDARRPERRERALAPFLPTELDRDAGLTPQGSQEVLWTEVASNQRALAGGRVITVAAQTTRQPTPLYLAVTVRHDPGRPVSLVGYPSFVGAPSVEVEPAAVERDPVEDPAVVEVVGRVVRNYVGGEAANLDADLTDDAVVTLPTLALQVASVDQVLWTGQGPESGAVLASVTATDAAGSSYRLTYELGLVFRDRPYVDFVQVIPTQG